MVESKQIFQRHVQNWSVNNKTRSERADRENGKTKREVKELIMAKNKLGTNPINEHTETAHNSKRGETAHQSNWRS